MYQCLIAIDQRFALSCRLVMRRIILSVVLLTCLGNPSYGSSRQTIVDIARKYGFPAPAVIKSQLRVKSQYTEMLFGANSRKLTIDGTLVWMNGPTRGKGTSMSIDSRDMSAVIAPLLTRDAILGMMKVETVVIDPGHGGSDTGAIGRRRTYEKKAVLDIAKRVKKKLRDKRVSATLTRNWDSSLALSTRTDRARKWHADLFVSIHLNSAGNRNASGIETYILSHPGFPSTSSSRTNDERYPANGYDAQNVILAYFTQKALLSQTGAVDRGIKHARFEVLKSAPCPAILVECGFLSNPKEEGRIIQKSYRDKLAEGIARGILDYVRRTQDIDNAVQLRKNEQKGI